MKILLVLVAAFALANGQAFQDDNLACPNGPGYYPHPESCAFFYICKEHQDGKQNKFVFHCPPGTLYDAEKVTCVLERFAHCDGSLPAKPRKIATTTLAPETTTEFKCSKIGFFRNPLNCNTFIQCYKYDAGELVEHLMKCPERTFFLEEKQPQLCVEPSSKNPLPESCPPLE